MSTDTSHFSIEFFPPRTPAGEEKLDIVHAELSKLGPEFFRLLMALAARHETGRSVRSLVSARQDRALHRIFRLAAATKAIF